MEQNTSSVVKDKYNQVDTAYEPLICFTLFPVVDAQKMILIKEEKSLLAMGLNCQM